METKRINGTFVPWSDAELLTNNLTKSAVQFELLDEKIKVTEKGNKLSVKVRIDGKSYWMDALSFGTKDDDGIDLPLKGICDVKDGKVLNILASTTA